MQAITISIDSKFNLLLQCPLHPLHGVISYCLDEACNLPLCILCIAGHCQAHFIKGTQPQLEDAGRLYSQFSEALQNILKQTEDIRKIITTYEGYSKQEQALLEEMERCKKNMHNLIDTVFEQKCRSIQEEFFSLSAKVNSLKAETKSYYEQLNTRETGAEVIHKLLQQDKLKWLLEELEQIGQKTANENNFLKSYKMIVEHDSIKQRMQEALDAYIKIYEEKTIFDAMNHMADKTHEAPVQNESNMDIDKKLEDIKNQLMSNLGETKPKKIFSESLSKPDQIQGSSREISRKQSTCKKNSKEEKPPKIRTPFVELQNLMQEEFPRISRNPSVGKKIVKKDNSQESRPQSTELENNMQEEVSTASNQQNIFVEIVNKKDQCDVRSSLAEDQNLGEQNLSEIPVNPNDCDKVVSEKEPSKINPSVAELENPVEGEIQTNVLKASSNKNTVNKGDSHEPQLQPVEFENVMEEEELPNDSNKPSAFVEIAISNKGDLYVIQSPLKDGENLAQENSLKTLVKPNDCEEISSKEEPCKINSPIIELEGPAQEEIQTNSLKASVKKTTVNKGDSHESEFQPVEFENIIEEELPNALTNAQIENQGNSYNIKSPLQEVHNIEQEKSLETPVKPNECEKIASEEEASKIKSLVAEIEDQIQEELQTISLEQSGNKNNMNNGDSCELQSQLVEPENIMQEEHETKSKKSSVSQKSMSQDETPNLRSPHSELHDMVEDTFPENLQKENVTKQTVSKSVSSRVQSPHVELENIQSPTKEDIAKKVHDEEVVHLERSIRENDSHRKNDIHEKSYLNQYANSIMEVEHSLLATNTPSKYPPIFDSKEHKSISKFEAVESKKVEEECQLFIEPSEGALDLPNENSFIPFRNRTSYDSLSQDTYWGSDSKNSVIRDFFSIEQFGVSDRESEALSRVNSIFPFISLQLTQFYNYSVPV